MKLSMRNYERIFNTIVNQIIFLNVHGEYEYHPERKDFLIKYFYLKYVEEHEFETEYTFDTDLFSLEFFDKLSDEIDAAMTDEVIERKINNKDFYLLEDVIDSKIEYEKEKSLRKSVYSITDVFLGELASKITNWLEDNGIEQFLEVVSKTGEELGNKHVQGTE